MADRETLYRQFGPQLIEALTKLTLNEINILRVKAGLEPRTLQQVVDALDSELQNCPDYNWMIELRQIP